MNSKVVVFGMLGTVMWLAGPAAVVNVAERGSQSEDVRVLPADRVRGIDQASLHVTQQRAIDALIQAQTVGRGSVVTPPSTPVRRGSIVTPPSTPVRRGSVVTPPS